MPIVGARLVTDALYGFLTTSDSVRASFNDHLATYRSQESLSIDELPDVVRWDNYVFLGSQTDTLSPYGGVIWESSSRETSNNSREVPHSLSILLMCVDRDVPGDEATLVQRSLDYAAVMRSMFLRATTPGAYGYTLNNGGTTGNARGRILRAEIVESESLFLSELNTANTLLRWGVEVVVIEDYPGA